MEKQEPNKGEIQLAKTDKKLIINNSCVFANKVRNEITRYTTRRLD